MSTSDVMRFALDHLLLSQPPQVVQGHRRYAEEHYLPDLVDDPVAADKLRYALRRIAEVPSEDRAMRLDSSEMEIVPDSTFDSQEMQFGPEEQIRFDGDEIFGPPRGGK